MKWLVSILIIISSANLYSDEIDNLLQNVPRDSNSVNDTLNRLTTNKTLFTPDGQSFESNLSCKSTNEFIQLFSHQDTNGDIDFLLALQDTNFDGTFNYNYQVPRHISGICSRGYVSCEAGTFDECKYYSWQANSALKLTSKEETFIDDLGTCSCINNSCRNGQSEATRKINMSHILGSITSTLNKVSGLTQVTESLAFSNYASAYGVKTTGCNSQSNPQIFANMDNVDLLNNKNNIKSGNSSNFTKLETDIYQSLSTGAVSSTSVESQRTCSIDRTVNFNTNNYTDQLLQSYESNIDWEIFQCATPNCLRLVHKKTYSLGGQQCQKKSNYIKFNDILGEKRILLKEFRHLSKPSKDAYFRPTENYPDDSFHPPLCPLDENEISEINKAYNGYIDYAEDDELDTNIIYEFSQPANASAAEYDVVIQIEYEPTSLCTIDEELISNNCTIYEEDQNCQLIEERQDNVQTIFNGIETGLIPNNVTKVLSECAVGVTRPFWNIKRKYQCEEDVEIDLAHAIQRYEHVLESATKNSYSDLRIDGNGQLVEESHTFKNTPEITVNGCEKKCKVKRKKEVSEALSTGTTKSQLVVQDTYVKYLTCANNICPISQNETVIKSCGCFNDFQEASLQMQVIRMAGKDVICVDE